MRSFLFKFSVLKSLKNYRLFYRVLPILSRTAALSSWFFAYFPCVSISCVREVMNHVCMDHITDQSDAATPLIFAVQKETGNNHRSLFVIYAMYIINLPHCSPQPLLLWLLLPSPVHRKGSARSGQIHRSNHLFLR